MVNTNGVHRGKIRELLIRVLLDIYNQKRNRGLRLVSPNKMSQFHD